MAGNDQQPTLVSLREIAFKLKAQECNIQTDVVMRIGDSETPWILAIDTDFPDYDTEGYPHYWAYLHRADFMPGERQFALDVTDTWGGLDRDVIAQQFGVEIDSRVWRIYWNYGTHDTPQT
jgi:hypothetical protein